MVPEDDDVPSGVDFHDPEHAREWVRTTAIRRPHRPKFFAAIADVLASLDSPRVLELGSGPGQLAREIMSRVATSSYLALDFSAVMHAIAREHLGPLADRVTFVERDFRAPDWPAGIGTFDAIVTMQAAHETRHRRHLVPLLERARSALVPGGLMLYCDHYATAASKPNLMAERDEQPLALERAGFSAVERLLEQDALALYRATA